MAELLLTAGTDDEFFTIAAFVMTPIMMYLMYITACDCDCDECRKKRRKE